MTQAWKNKSLGLCFCLFCSFCYRQKWLFFQSRRSTSRFVFKHLLESAELFVTELIQTVWKLRQVQTGVINDLQVSIDFMTAASHLVSKCITRLDPSRTLNVPACFTLCLFSVDYVCLRVCACARTVQLCNAQGQILSQSWMLFGGC